MTKIILLFSLLGFMLLQPLHAQNGFSIAPIPDAVFERMQGKSYPKDCPIKRSQLRYVQVLHYDFEGKVQKGELVCDKAIAHDVVAVFKKLYKAKYPIQRIRLIDDYGADDETSMRANNTSCFCFRKVKGSRKLSAHARGRAIDINPLYNPCVRKQRNGRVVIQPSTASKYANRNAAFAHKISHSDQVYKVFIAHGFKWGGAWRSVKDYQHFEK